MTVEENKIVVVQV